VTTKRFMFAGMSCVLGISMCVAAVGRAAAQTRPASAANAATSDVAERRAILDQYCVTCHNGRLRVADLDLDGVDLSNVGEHAELLEKVVRKMRAGAMPPPLRPRPEKSVYDGFRTWLEGELDESARARPNPGRTEAFQRLNQTHYRNAVRDLLDLEIDVSDLLPGDVPDEHGFDNNGGALSFSPVLMERYISAAHKVAALAVGAAPRGEVIATYDVPLRLDQDYYRGEDLPFGSRGGTAIHHTFPASGEYLIRVTLQTNYVEFPRGMDVPHDIEVSLDGRLLQQFVVGGAAPGRPAPYSYEGNIRGDDEWESFMMGFTATGLEAQASVSGGPHVLGVTFPRETWEQEGVRQPPQIGYPLAINGMPDANPRIGRVEIIGPIVFEEPGDTPSRRTIFSCRPARAVEEPACATEILSTLARRMYRRPIEDGDVATLLDFYEAGKAEGGFEAGIQYALERLLTSPDFLFRVERAPVDLPSETAYAVSDSELASRLSFFLWGSIPDDELLAVAESTTLSAPDVLDRQVLRMLADPKATSLVQDFAGQWLYLRNIDSVHPTPNEFPEFDHSLREAFKMETELFLEHQLREDRSVIDLLSADYTFLNERLARHYDIPGVYGSRFRQVQLEGSHRAGLLGHGSLMTVTSYPNRTSPVLRGKYILENFLGAPPPEPPPNVPTLEEESEDGRALSMREAMERHRVNPTCASCHATMDPIGFSLENFDAVGAFRQEFENQPIDASGTMPDGDAFAGPAGLRGILLDRSDLFVGTLTQKMMTYALGRGLEYYDMPTVRQIVREAADDDYRWSSIVLGIVRSAPFQMRRSH
jgi:mono/diheme cytochrome c family protein